MNSAVPGPLLRFAQFEVNLEAAELRRNGYHIRLQQKPFEILGALLERPGRLVTRDELHRRLWPDNTYVDFDHNLNNAVNKLRKALNDSLEEPKFVQTVPRRGYRFVAPVERIAASIPDALNHPLPQVTDVTAVTSDSQYVTATLSPPVMDDPALVLLPARLRNALAIRNVLGVLFLLALFWVSARFLSHSALPIRPPTRSETSINSLLIRKDGGLDPIEEGFILFSIGQNSSAVMRSVTGHGIDRWKITSNDQAYYYHPLSPDETRFAFTRDWNLTCVCSVERGQASANIDFGKGLRRFDIELLREGDKSFVALTKQISPELEWDQKIEFSGAGDVDHPHTYELRYDHLAQTASLWIDGRLTASGYRGHRQFLENRGLFFGSYSYFPHETGVGIFRREQFEVH